MIRNLGGWLVDVLSGLLDSDERDVVRGDLAECGTAGSQALHDVLGLVARRQLDQWTHSRTWLTLVGLIVPLGMVLSVVSRRTADMSSVYLWMYANNWRWHDLGNAGFWRVLGETVVLVFTSQLTLVCWSWTVGFVVGSVSRGIIQSNGLVLSLTLLLGSLVGAPRYFAYFEHYLHQVLAVPALPDLNAPVFALIFYREMLPLIVQLALVMIPALRGAGLGAGTARVSPVLRVILWAAAIVALGSMVTQSPDVWFFLKMPRQLWIVQGWWTHWAQMVVYWPVAYLVASAIKRRWRAVTPAS